MRHLLLLITALSLLTIGCQGEVGPVGPQGPQGPAGEDGTDGAANIQTYERSWDTADIFWQTSGYGEVAFPIEQLTSTIVDEGVVLAYYGGNGAWIALPFTSAQDYNGDGEDETMEFTYGYKEGSFSVVFHYFGPSTTPQDFYPTGTVKIVFIPPSEVSAKMKGQTNIPYSEIEDLLNN